MNAQDVADEKMAMAVSSLRFAADDLRAAETAYAKADLWSLAGDAGSYLMKIQAILDDHDGAGEATK